MNIKKIRHDEVLLQSNFPEEFILWDHNFGFTKHLYNRNLTFINQQAIKNNQIFTVWWHEYLTKEIKENYSNIIFKFDMKGQEKFHFRHFHNYNTHPILTFENFLCSFNGSDHVGRQLLTSILRNQNFFDSNYSSKNFAYDNDWIVSHLDNLDLTNAEIQLYSKFFVNDDEFNNSIYSFGLVQYDHKNNIYNLEHKLTQSFVHIVSETLSTSYYPYVSEKSIYSIVTRGLFLAYAQPTWHRHIEKYYGFKLYDTIFDYSFDSIQNPVKRLIKLIEMVSKFSSLSTDDWRDLYHLEQDKIEYNYDHYFSCAYKKHLAQFE